MTFKNIIVGTDFSKKSTEAVAVAGILANKTSAQLHLIHVCNYFEDNIPPFTNTNIVAEGKTFKELVENNLKTAFNNQIQAAKLNTDIVVTEILYGNPKEQLQNYIQEKKGDLLVLGYHGHNILSKIFLGSTTNQMLKSSPCDVLVVKEAMKEPTLKKIMSCVDFTPISDSVIEKSKNIAKSFSSQMTIANIIEPNPQIYYALAQADGFDGIANMKEALENEKKVTHEKMTKIASQINTAGVQATAIVRETNDFKTAKGLNKLAQEEKSDLMVIGSHSQSQIDRFLFGSTAEGIVNESKINVLVIKN